ncbi:unnamed protein product [Allacma fusca]|uniref:Uncharacterized protein n=1 Tax=Allacma fusca TaxID=39272 RepID=A0A8J2JXK8_9HEXA|nr:unnamed protein product [Allacma fusca]
MKKKIKVDPNFGFVGHSNTDSWDGMRKERRTIDGFSLGVLKLAFEMSVSKVYKATWISSNVSLVNFFKKPTQMGR